MPTARFYQLPENKRQSIIQAIAEEYKRRNFVNLNLLSVAKAAGVSRTSLYTYFRDKDEMLQFAFEKEWSMRLK